MRGAWLCPRAAWECLAERAGRPRGLGPVPVGPRGTPGALGVQCWGHEPAASPPPSPWSRPRSRKCPSPKRPDTGVTSAPSWCAAPLDTLLVSDSRLGSEPDSACPFLARAELSARVQWPGVWERPGLACSHGTSLLLSCGYKCSLLTALPHPSCLYLPGDMTPQSPVFCW